MEESDKKAQTARENGRLGGRPTNYSQAIRALTMVGRKTMPEAHEIWLDHLAGDDRHGATTLIRELLPRWQQMKKPKSQTLCKYKPNRKAPNNRRKTPQ